MRCSALTFTSSEKRVKRPRPVTPESFPLLGTRLAFCTVSDLRRELGLGNLHDSNASAPVESHGQRLTILPSIKKMPPADFHAITITW